MLDASGAPVGAEQDLHPGFSSGAVIASDGERYVVCANEGPLSFDLRCGWLPVGGGAFALGATFAVGGDPALAFGPGGFMLAYQTSAGITVQALDANAQLAGSAHDLAPGAGPPSIVPTEDGYVLGYATSTAHAQRLTASGTADGSAIDIGPARMGTQVAVAYIPGTIGATFIEPDGDAAAWTQGNAEALTIGPGAMSNGRVSMAPANDGFLAAWSDLNGFVGLLGLTEGGAPNGFTSMISTGWDDSANAIAANGAGFVIATPTGSESVTTTSLRCP